MKESLRNDAQRPMAAIIRTYEEGVAKFSEEEILASRKISHEILTWAGAITSKK